MKVFIYLTKFTFLLFLTILISCEKAHPPVLEEKYCWLFNTIIKVDYSDECEVSDYTFNSPPFTICNLTEYEAESERLKIQRTQTFSLSDSTGMCKIFQTAISTKTRQ